MGSKLGELAVRIPVEIGLVAVTDLSGNISNCMLYPSWGENLAQMRLSPVHKCGCRLCALVDATLAFKVFVPCMRRKQGFRTG